jgi:hypothetical protein
MTMQENAVPGMTETEKTDRIPGTDIILHYANEEESKAKQIMNQLNRLGAHVQLETHKTSEVNKHKNTIYYYKGNEAGQSALQIKNLLSDTESFRIVESKVWWFWIDMNKINLWL